ncbi:MAG: hypothetical protein AB1489_39085 [Acidobacteriota bacterium]
MPLLLLNTEEWKSVERQSFNRYSYILKPVFVNQELVMAGLPPRGSFPAHPRVERYRYKVKAEVDVLVYDDVRYKMIAYYDVIITAAGLDERVSCGPNAGRFQSGFGNIRVFGLDECPPAPSTPGFEPSCNGRFCVNGEGCYDASCQNEKDKSDSCKQEVEDNDCSPDPDTGFIFCRTSQGTVFATATGKSYSSNGCASLGANTSGYLWTTTIKLVSLGTNYD